MEPLFGWAEWKRRHYAPDAVISAAASEGLQKLGFDRVASIGLASVASWLDGKRPPRRCGGARRRLARAA